MRIRSKLLALIAVPLLALAIAATFGFRNQSIAIERAEDAFTTARRNTSIHNAILAIGNERLVRLGGEVEDEGHQGHAGTGDDDQLDVVETTDLSLAALLSELRTEDDLLVAQSVEDLVHEARLSEAGGARQYIEANAALTAIDANTAGDFPTASARNTAIANRLSLHGVENLEIGWIAYLDLDGDASNGWTNVTESFVSADVNLSAAARLSTEDGVEDLTVFLQSDPATQLAELELVALDDLAEGNVSVADEQIISGLSEFRLGFTAAHHAMHHRLTVQFVTELDDANNVRSLFILLGTVGVLVLAGLVFVIYHSITKPLDSLLDRARRVANEELPRLVDRLRDDDGNEDLPVATPIETDSTDEIADLVEAFNDVQSTAYQLATEQAVGRRNVGEMFVNLGRRNQRLLQRILSQLTQLENDEEDPDKLAELFKLDNIVTRMRRNAESLLALAGAQSPRQWSKPVTIENTVRAAMGEIEGYQRIDIAELGDVNVAGSTVADITHLLAELMENAASFSEPQTRVIVAGRLRPDGYSISVSDNGIGMSRRELLDNNSRITEPPALDQVPTRFLGLHVVGRLAERHGIEVTLADDPNHGTVATVLLPSSIIVNEQEESDDMEPETLPVRAKSSVVHEAAEHDLSRKRTSAANDEKGGSPETTSAKPLPIRKERRKPLPDLPTDGEHAATEKDTTKAQIATGAEIETTGEGAEESVAESEPPSKDARPGQLPMRARGETLQTETPTSSDRIAVQREATDTSEKSADAFSSMMSAFIGGVNRVQDDSEHEE